MESQNLYVDFLEKIQTAETSVFIFLKNGTKLEGQITAFDRDGLLLSKNGKEQFVYIAGIATIMPAD